MASVSKVLSEYLSNPRYETGLCYYFLFFINLFVVVHMHRKSPWRRKWQLTPVFLPGESHGQRSLARYSSWGCKELDTTEHTHNIYVRLNMKL